MHGVQSGKVILWAVTALVFLLSATTNGLMPLRGSEGVVMVICSGEGPLELHIDPQTGEPADDKTPDRHKPCDWASFNFTADVPGAPVSPGNVAPILAETALIASSILTASRATGLPPSTGPPAVI
ncbi:hypothetical protein D3P04_01370 [Paracoccus onubensis]|uniref:DUF2946 domain-containing protein n=2 Tax=Paracoccus onubensis TaxID=1675788 RepID=A0A418T7W6_9RHOB|nr:hypothetical protein D3P04_01370 [Paracoccus onubensis]